MENTHVEVLGQRLDNVEHNSKAWWAQMQEALKELKQNMQALPDEIVERLDEKTDLKIQAKIAIVQLEVRDVQQNLQERIIVLYRWIAGLSLTCLASLIVAVLSIALGGK